MSEHSGAHQPAETRLVFCEEMDLAWAPDPTRGQGFATQVPWLGAEGPSVWGAEGPSVWGLRGFGGCTATRKSLSCGRKIFSHSAGKSLIVDFGAPHVLMS